MKSTAFYLLVLAMTISSWTSLHAEQIALAEPLDFQVIQRTSKKEGTMRIRGRFTDGKGAKFEARVTFQDDQGRWQKLRVRWKNDSFETTLKVAAGGWYRLELRVTRDGELLGTTEVKHVGIGEVFVVAGQSNSANYGEERQTTKTKLVATLSGHRWRLADDPQPGADGASGSFMPPLGDLLVQRFNVPVGFIACGIGATSVREWLPKDSTFPNPPTIEARVARLPNGQWASNGQAFSNLVQRIKPLGPHGFRAVLWHQGESDANQQDASRTLPGPLYRDYLEQVIRVSRHEIGWKSPWFVAQASYHTPGDEASADIRAAQASVWKDGVAFEGPDTDALKGPLREQHGMGVHFSAQGLQMHAAKWAEKLSPWLDRELQGRWWN